MSELNEMNGETLDIEKQNIEKLKELFPEIVTEDKIDFEKFRVIFGDEVETSSEKYSFTWNGKNDSIKLAQQPSTGTLRPNKKKSKNWDMTDNLYIEGDNLEVLKLLQKSYARKIKVIYIDPPYNTGNDFVYKDKFKDNIENYLEQTGQVDSKGNKFSTNAESSGRYHTDWLNMMYPRLILAKNLLAEDGVIFISIDEHEYPNLRKLMNEIFGDSNYRNTLLVRRRVKSLNFQFSDNGLNTFNVGAEYIVAYSKSDSFKYLPIEKRKKSAPSKGKWNVFWSNADRPTMRYELLGFTPETGQWRWSQEKAEEAVNNYKIFEEKYSDYMTLEEYWNKDRSKKFIRRIENGKGKNGGVQYYVGPSTHSLRTSDWTDIEVSQISKDFDLPFDNPKNVKLIEEVLKSVGEAEYVLDFFSGSSTTADAVMRLNAQDGLNRKFIMVQLPEVIKSNSNFNNLSEVGQERIRQAGRKIISENPKMSNALDTGFKVLELDNSNIRKWNIDSDNLEDSLFALENNFMEDRTHEDIMYEVLLKLGLDLNTSFEEIMVAGSTVYNVALGNVYVVLGENITQEVANYIADKQKDYENENPSVVFNDNGFVNDNEKLNTIEILKNNGFNQEQLMSI